MKMGEALIVPLSRQAVPILHELRPITGNQRHVHPDLIELQLAHAERNKVRAAYNRAQRLAERRVMMQLWADYVDTLRSLSGNEARAHAMQTETDLHT